MTEMERELGLHLDLNTNIKGKISTRGVLPDNDRYRGAKNHRISHLGHARSQYKNYVRSVVPVNNYLASKKSGSKLANHSRKRALSVTTLNKHYGHLGRVQSNIDLGIVTSQTVRNLSRMHNVALTDGTTAHRLNNFFAKSNQQPTHGLQ